MTGGHTYAKSGTYTTHDRRDRRRRLQVTIFGSATVTDLPVTGSTRTSRPVEGQNTGTFVLATFTDPNTLATVADVTRPFRRRLGRRYADARSSTLRSSEIGVDATTGDPIFEVLGSHTYAEEARRLPTPQYHVTTLGGVTTTLTARHWSPSSTLS